MVKLSEGSLETVPPMRTFIKSPFFLAGSGIFLRYIVFGIAGTATGLCDIFSFFSFGGGGFTLIGQLISSSLYILIRLLGIVDANKGQNTFYC